MLKKICKFIALSFAFTLAAQAQTQAPTQQVIAVQQAEIQALKKQIELFQQQMGSLKTIIKNNVLELSVNWCDGKMYNCSVRACVDLCTSKGGRVAHRSELATIALKKVNHCAHTISYDVANNRFDRSYPMYNFAGDGCWNSNSIPSMPLLPTEADQAGAIQSANCACMLPVSVD